MHFEKRRVSRAPIVVGLFMAITAASGATPLVPDIIPSHDPFQIVDGLTLDDFDKKAVSDRINTFPSAGSGVFYPVRVAMNDEEVSLVVTSESYNKFDRKWGYHARNNANIQERVICVRKTGELRLYTTERFMGISWQAPKVAIGIDPLQHFKFPQGHLYVFHRDAYSQDYARKLVMNNLLSYEKSFEKNGPLILQDDTRRRFLEACPQFK